MMNKLQTAYSKQASATRAVVFAIGAVTLLWWVIAGKPLAQIRTDGGSVAAEQTGH